MSTLGRFVTGQLYKFTGNPVNCDGIRTGRQADLVKDLYFEEGRAIRQLCPKEEFIPGRKRKRGPAIVGGPKGTWVFIGTPTNKEKDVYFYFGVVPARCDTGIAPVEEQIEQNVLL